jgi:hypothetical protein
MQRADACACAKYIRCAGMKLCGKLGTIIKPLNRPFSNPSFQPLKPDTGAKGGISFQVSNRFDPMVRLRIVRCSIVRRGRGLERCGISSGVASGSRIGTHRREVVRLIAIEACNPRKHLYVERQRWIGRAAPPGFQPLIWR